MKKELILFQLQIDSVIDSDTTYIVIYGKDKDKPKRVFVTDFLPYLYVEAPEEDIKNDLLCAISNYLNKGKVVMITESYKYKLYGHSIQKYKFYKIFFTTPQSLTPAKILLQNIKVKNKNYSFQCYEANINYVLKCMIDLNIVGMSYLKIKDYFYNECGDICCSFKNIEQLPFNEEYSLLPPLKILSFDIECVSDSFGFPVPTKDPVIQIGNTIYHNGAYEKIIFCLKETEKIPGAQVLWFENEVTLLERWFEFVKKCDPDIIMGFNIKNFDFPYLFDREKILKIENYEFIGRSERKAKIRDFNFSSRQQGSTSSKEIEMDGRLIFDLYQIIKKDYKLRSYSLNNVSVHFLGDQKEDLPFYEIKKLQEKDKNTRKRIATYCLKDSYLPLVLFNKLNILLNYTELSRVTGIPVDWVTLRGQSIKVLSLIFRKTKECDYLCPTLEVTENESTYEGGFVMDPLKGFYSDPISVLDFSSLYPSIMISNNLCYTTLIYPKDIHKYKEDEFIKTPTNNFFVKKNVKEGLLPQIFNYLLGNRKKTKQMINEVDDEGLKNCLQARQIAFKLAANSIYGFTGSMVGKLPCLEISQSTTAFGRNMIVETKRMIEETYLKGTKIKCDDLNYTFNENVKVIYGDTDSVMIDLKEKDINIVYKISKNISEFVSSKFVKPVSLEFEKVYFPFLLINKKRYAGLIHKSQKVDTKGIETVRRDNCELVKNVVETCLKYILWERNIEKAKEYVKNTIRDMYMDKIDLSQLVISKSISKRESKYLVKQAHVVLAEKMRKRDPNTAPGLGDRVAYVIIKGEKNAPAYERSEDPLYVLEKGLQIDIEYYVEHQLANPIFRIFEPILPNVSELLKGDHTRTHVAASAKGPMSQFIKKAVTCVGCKTPGKILCDFCKKDFVKHFLTLQTEVENKKVVFSECWVECQRCMGSVSNEVMCVNKDCPIFYKRTKVMKDLETSYTKLEKLRNFDW
ncbi:dna polymerase delta catalytic subunit [Tubulinosema ratisbonensis]|uniref:DNA polymerase n=1 Tax=Tubulinosema ratisbonensis TaxID=291195 RepID=A0A437APB6_9MICR|nr:dna polymerase delta catalytic subunit [Tubulinosema ratisbonensis]